MRVNVGTKFEFATIELQIRVQVAYYFWKNLLPIRNFLMVNSKQIPTNIWNYTKYYSELWSTLTYLCSHGLLTLPALRQRKLITSLSDINSSNFCQLLT